MSDHTTNNPPPSGDPSESGYWADAIAARLSGRQVVNDSKSPSGTVHIGSLRGVILHDTITRAIRSAGLPCRFLYGVDDMDAMDNQALLTPNAITRYMGAPLCNVPAPAGSDAANYARHFVGQLFFELFAPLGINPEFYWVSELYARGDMDGYVRQALEGADVVRAIYANVSKVIKDATWLPLQVICENCGKIGTTYASDWDGNTVAYTCRPGLVKWAQACGYSGRVSPFGGRAKLPWNLEWAAKWGLFGVTLEGCGKDLSTAGGSRDRSEAIADKVFGITPPASLPYEFLNIGGKKMTTSGGRGAAAHEIARILAPEQMRFLFLRTRPNTVIDFDAGGDTIPRIYDEFDRIAAAVAGHPVRGALPAEPAALFGYSLPDPEADTLACASAFRPAFNQLSMLRQMPGTDLEASVAAEKGAPLDEMEIDLLAARNEAVGAWLADYAPPDARIEVSYEELPALLSALSAAQRAYLGDLASRASAQTPSSGEAWQSLLYGLATETGLGGKEAFAAIYAAFLGRNSGPRAGWLLAGLDQEFVRDRLEAASRP